MITFFGLVILATLIGTAIGVSLDIKIGDENA